ncbi:hypothetical protein DQ04_03731040 [Trypanosoma grayi]|uniref:hypothetical protein n=1 Tax=Trypanosoma grayi TaxID=71804 RepID=UPI0004F475AC|nr:hypothetical protein DQ04_03731040 [Trypanosoma grayi]KEG10422.1 hypothetical protein DQ04_03731040 [Trypanosoma grayi]
MEAGTASEPQNDGERRRQSFQIVELLVDLIYGDLVRGDRCCRRVADALIASYEDAIRWLVTREQTFNAALKGAINTYCARYVLRTAPELLIASKETAAAYTRIAAVLREGDGLTCIGEAMADELSHLTRRLETRRFARLLDLMGNAVVAYMRQASDQHEKKEEAPGEFLLRQQDQPAFWASVGRFAVEAPLHGGHKRQREDEGQPAATNGATPTRGFSEEIRLAMSSPVRTAAPPVVSPGLIACAQQQQQQQQQQPSPSSIEMPHEEEMTAVVQTVAETATPPRARRAILQVNDSVVSAAEKLEGNGSCTAQDTSSGLVIDDSLGAPSPSSGHPQRGDVAAAGAGSGCTSVPEGDVHVRSYFLCAKTGRYEPAGARGFFA